MKGENHGCYKSLNSEENLRRPRETAVEPEEGHGKICFPRGIDTTRQWAALVVRKIGF